MKRFNPAVQGEQVASEYDIPSEEIHDILNRGVSPIKVFTEAQINLAAAGTLVIDEPGYGFVWFAQTAAGVKYSEGLINVFINKRDSTELTSRFPSKPNRGYAGGFSRLFLQWPADASGVYKVVFYVFKSRQYPWIGGQECS